MMPPRYIHLAEADSTNSVAAGMPAPAPGECTVIYTDRQTAGRGQRGNSWESEPGKNLTFSLVFAPRRWPAVAQFTLSMAVALGMYDALRNITIEDRVRIKWPNDIYFDDRKIAGILIENTLSGPNISRSIIGIGLNVNQTCWLSDAPNPMSLKEICGDTLSLQATLGRVVNCICRRLGALDDTLVGDADGRPHSPVADEYMRHLWRCDGFSYPWYDLRGGSRKAFTGRIRGLAPWGHLMIEDAEGQMHVFELKQLAADLGTPSAPSYAMLHPRPCD